MAQSFTEAEGDRALRDELLGPLHMHFLAARQAYGDYLDNGRSFLFAASLRRINGAARDLLMTRGHLLPEAHLADALALLRHYDAWLTLWDRHAAEMQPAPGDPFAFDNSITFPREAQQRLERLFVSLRSAG